MLEKGVQKHNSLGNSTINFDAVSDGGLNTKACKETPLMENEWEKSTKDRCV